MSLVSDFLQKQRYRLKIYYNETKIFQRGAPVKGQTSVSDNTHKLAYLLPENLRPFRENNQHIILYDVSDSCPMADLKDIVPDLVAEFETDHIAPEIKKGIDEYIKSNNSEFDTEAKKYREAKEAAETIENLVREHPDDHGLTAKDLEDYEGIKKYLEQHPEPPKPKLSFEEEEKLSRVKQWLDSRAGTAKLYQLWRWGYLKKESWYKKLGNKQKIESLVFPKKIQRVGLRPYYLYEREHSTMIPDIIRRPESKFGWLEGPVTALIIVFGIIVIAWLVFT